MLSHFKIEKHLYYLLLCHNFQSTSDCFKGLPILDMAMIARNAHRINNKAYVGDSVYTYVYVRLPLLLLEKFLPK